MAGIKEEAFFVAGPEDGGVAGGAVDVDVEDGEEDGDFEGGAVEGGVVGEFGDFGHFAVGGCDHHVGIGWDGAVEIAIEGETGGGEDEEDEDEPIDVEHEEEEDGEEAAYQDGEPVGPAVEGEEELWGVTSGWMRTHGGEYRGWRAGCKGGS